MKSQIVNRWGGSTLKGLMIAIGVSIQAITGSAAMVPIYVMGAGGLNLSHTLRSRLLKRLSFMGIIALFTVLSIGVADPAHALFFNRIDTILNTAISAFGVSEISAVRGWVVNGLKFVGVVIVGGIVIASLKSRPGDDEENSAGFRRFIGFFIKLLLGDLLLSLFGV